MLSCMRVYFLGKNTYLNNPHSTRTKECWKISVPCVH